MIRVLLHCFGSAGRIRSRLPSLKSYCRFIVFPRIASAHAVLLFVLGRLRKGRSQQQALVGCAEPVNDFHVPGIPEIKKSFDLVAKAVRDDKPDECRDALKNFRRTASLSDDLLFDHARALVDQVEERMDKLIEATKTVRAEETTEVPTLDDFNPFAARLTR